VTPVKVTSAEEKGDEKAEEKVPEKSLLRFAFLKPESSKVTESSKVEKVETACDEKGSGTFRLYTDDVDSPERGRGTESSKVEKVECACDS